MSYKSSNFAIESMNNTDTRVSNHNNNMSKTTRVMALRKSFADAYGAGRRNEYREAIQIMDECVMPSIDLFPQTEKATSIVFYCAMQCRLNMFCPEKMKVHFHNAATVDFYSEYIIEMGFIAISAYNNQTLGAELFEKSRNMGLETEPLYKWMYAQYLYRICAYSNCVDHLKQKFDLNKAKNAYDLCQRCIFLCVGNFSVPQTLDFINRQLANGLSDEMCWANAIYGVIHLLKLKRIDLIQNFVAICNTDEWKNLTLLGICYALLGDIENAMKSFAKALNLAEKTYNETRDWTRIDSMQTVQFWFAYFLIMYTKDCRKAEKLLTNVLRIRPLWSEAQFLYAKCVSNIENCELPLLKSAKKHLIEAIQRSPALLSIKNESQSIVDRLTYKMTNVNSSSTSTTTPTIATTVSLQSAMSTTKDYTANGNTFSASIDVDMDTAMTDESEGDSPESNRKISQLETQMKSMQSQINLLTQEKRDLQNTVTTQGREISQLRRDVDSLLNRNFANGTETEMNDGRNHKPEFQNNVLIPGHSRE